MLETMLSCIHEWLRTMIDTCKLHNDLEDFAKFLGVDYEDYYQLIYNLSDEDEYDVELELTA